MTDCRQPVAGGPLLQLMLQLLLLPDAEHARVSAARVPRPSFLGFGGLGACPLACPPGARPDPLSSMLFSHFLPLPAWAAEQQNGAGPWPLASVYPRG